MNDYTYKKFLIINFQKVLPIGISLRELLHAVLYNMPCNVSFVLLSLGQFPSSWVGHTDVPEPLLALGDPDMREEGVSSSKCACVWKRGEREGEKILRVWELETSKATCTCICKLKKLGASPCQI